MKTYFLALLLAVPAFGSAMADSSKDKDASKDASWRAKLEVEAPAELLLRTKDAPSTSKSESLRLQSKKSSRF